MSRTTINITLDRIASAPVDSPIAVFYCGATAIVNSVFARTAFTETLIERGARRLIGVYHQRMPRDQVRAEIITRLKLLDDKEFANGTA